MSVYDNKKQSTSSQKEALTAAVARNWVNELIAPEQKLAFLQTLTTDPELEKRQGAFI